jgi:RHS repeat-associated protein
MTRIAHIQPNEATGGKPPETYCVPHSQLLLKSKIGACLGESGAFDEIPCSVFIPLQRSVFGVQCSVFSHTHHSDPEPNWYIYHSDHLGSSAFLTDAAGDPTQHLQYMPFGETFVEQRAITSYYTPYTFSAKERDTETGYSYFGARYYDADISIWLSVDPMADKYPYQSGYCYVGWRPIMVVDPNGEDEWEVTFTGRVKWVKESETHTLYVLNRKGERTGESLTLNDRSIFDQLVKGGKVSKAVGDEKTQDAMMKTFRFLADNTDVEWALHRFKEDGKNKFALGSNHSLPADLGGGQTSPGAESMGHSSASVIAFVHSHPNTANDIDSEISSMGWWPIKGTNRVETAGDVSTKKNHYPNAYYYTYFPKSGRLWVVQSNRRPAFIRNISRNYKRFFFGTLNTK